MATTSSDAPRREEGIPDTEMVCEMASGVVAIGAEVTTRPEE
jgi:hypothetical protein